MRFRRGFAALVLIAGGLAACDDSSSSSSEADASIEGAETSTPDTSAPDVDNGDVDVLADGGTDGGTDTGSDAGDEPEPLPSPTLDGPLPYETLSEYGFYVGDMNRLVPAAGVIPYELAAPLWSDDAFKARFFVLPTGGTIDVGEDGAWTFPVGTIIIKNFYYPDDMRQPEADRRVIETRLLVRTEDEWENHEYIWNDEQTEAERFVAGKITTVSYIDRDGEAQDHPYVIPNTNQCDNCHSNYKETAPIGPRTSQINREVMRDGSSVNQFQWLNDLGVLSGAMGAVEEMPRLVDPMGDAPLEQRARAYLEAQCAHCHRPGGEGGPSGLVLSASETDPAAYGVCKKPVAAGAGSGGFFYAISPGDPDSSILVYRMSSVDAAIKMPEIPNLQVDPFGVDLVRDWITEMELPACD